MLHYRQLSVNYNYRKLVSFNTASEFNKVAQDFVKNNPNDELYASLYMLEESTKAYCDEHGGSIEGYSGLAVSQEIVFDFDVDKRDLSEDSLNKPRKDALTVINRIKEDLKLDNINDYVRVYFSGGKGFHLYFKTSNCFTNEEIKSICFHYAKDLETFDTSIYDKVRIFRLPNSKHKSGLYKIEIWPTWLSKENCISEIKREAQKPREQPLKDYKIIPDLTLLLQYAKEIIEEKPKQIIVESTSIGGIRGLDRLDYSECPKDTPRCIWALTQGIFVPGIGERNRIYKGLGNYYRNKSIPKSAVEGILIGINTHNLELYPEAESYKEQIKKEIMPVVFSKINHKNLGGWGIDPKDEVFQRYCNCLDTIKKCPIHQPDRYNKIIKISDVSNSFSDFASNYDKNVVKTGIQFIDNEVEFMRGTTNLLIGAPGSSKTSLALEIMEKSSSLGLDTMFFSADMHKNMVYLKLAMKLTDYKKHEIFEFFKNKQKYMKEIEEIKKAIDKNYNRTFFDFSSSISMEDIKERVIATEDANNCEIKLVVVDYASRLIGPYSDAYANAKFNALKAKEVADETNTALLIINQISRMNGDGSTPLRSKRVAKDAGDWEESASSIITIWRPYMSMEGRETEDGTILQDNIVRLFVAKNRMGREIEQPLWWEGARGKITDMSPEDLRQYKETYEKYEAEVPKIKNNRGSFS